MAVKVNLEKCTGCGECVANCPAESIKIVDGKAKIDADTCADCGACVGQCAQEAITQE